MQKIKSGSVLFVSLLAMCGGLALGQTVRPDVKVSAMQVDREIDPDASTAVPFDEFESFGTVAGGDECELIGGVSSPSAAPRRYRGNLYRIADSGVFLNEIRMQLAFAGNADLFVSVHRKMANGTYEEVDISSSPTQGFVFLDNVTGAGATAFEFYSSGLLNGATGIELPPGDYAIGFAWGPESVRYGRDSGVAFPRPMDVGSVLKSVSRELTLAEPPVLAELPGLAESATGAYSQQLCFVPVEGACCLSEGAASRCENLLELDCVGEGSFFHGQRTTCKDTICEFGACCFECDTPIQNFVARCGDDYTEDSCAVAGGINFWTEVSCPAPDESLLCPKLVGACCNGATCNLKCETECVAGGGTYEGDNTNCDPNTHVCKGACCVLGGCLDRTQSGCTGSNGTFKGRGTRCFSETCSGACCYGFTDYDFCDVYDDRSLCTYSFDPVEFEFIAYRGDGTQCPSPPDSCDPSIGNPYKACCLPDGSCMNTFESVCTASWIQGEFDSSGTCDAVGPCQTGRCCFGNGDCQELTQHACAIRAGAYGGDGTTCSASACNSLAGACCGTGVGICTMKTASQCNAADGFYQGDATDCTNATVTCPGYGACCRGNDDCFELYTPAQCANVEGASGAAGSTCDQVDCETRGACCAVTGTCLLTSVGTCAGIGGEFQCIGEVCAPGVCVSGACCLPNEGCKKRTPLACAEASGVFQGSNTSCTPQTCATKGGCCRQGACTIEEPGDCDNAGDAFLGNGTVCGANACVLGSCCRINGSCLDNVPQGRCIGSGDLFTVAGSCNSAQCIPRGACCDDGDCSITIQQQCIGTFHGNGIPCGVDTCALTGACCDGNTCFAATQVDCGLAGGRFRGIGINCAAISCANDPCAPTGACCTGTSCTETTEVSCGGTYRGDGVSCASNPCGATGACCNGTTCTIKSSSACVTGGGEYKGDDAPCEVDTCPPPPATGACCSGVPATCTVTTSALCTGNYQGDNSPCSPDPCQIGTCTQIISSVPGNCAIDARRTHDPTNPSVLEGWDFIDLTFDCDTTNHVSSDYAVSVIASGAPPAGPTVESVTPNGTTIQLNLSEPIPPGAWTCFTYTPAGLDICFGFLPADADGGRASVPTDILAIVDHLNTVTPLPTIRCDIDRSGQCNPNDLLTEIDLLNGANTFLNWNGKTLPVCPSGP